MTFSAVTVCPRCGAASAAEATWEPGHVFEEPTIPGARGELISVRTHGDPPAGTQIPDRWLRRCACGCTWHELP